MLFKNQGDLKEPDVSHMFLSIYLTDTTQMLSPILTELCSLGSHIKNIIMAYNNCSTEK